MRSGLQRGLLTVWAVLTLAPAAHAYAEPVHAALPRWIFPRHVQAARMPPVPPQALADFRHRFYVTAATLPDRGLRQGFLTRYPQEADFTAAAFKEFLALNPQASVWGIDRAPDKPMSLGALWSISAAAPDGDGRNRDRLLRDRRGRAVRLADGSPVPADPMVLAIGRATGLSSQAHAHYGLPDVPKSEDPGVLKSDPRRFAVPADIVTYADVNGQLWTDMAILAQVWGSPTLAAIHEGAWQHFAEDVSNQVHAVQVGIYDFFVDAKIRSILDWCWSLGGLLWTPVDFRDLGVTIVSNHHLLSEYYFEKRMNEVLSGTPRQSPRAARVLEALREDDADLLARIEQAQQKDEWAAAMIRQLSDVSSREGADLYRVTRRFAQKRLSEVGTTFRYGIDDPDAFVRPPGEDDTKAALDEYYALYEKAFRRAGTMVRHWQDRFKVAVARPKADQAAVARIVGRQLAYWKAADARRQSWLVGKTLLDPALAAK